MRTPAASLLLLLAACQPQKYSDHYTVYVDPAMGDRMADVVSALDAWQSQAFGLTLDVRIGDKTCGYDCDCDSTITIHPATLADIRAWPDAPANAWATTHNIPSTASANIYVGIELGDNQAAYSILHEIGHGLGLVHTGDGTLMCYSWDCADHVITCADLQQYAALRHETAFCSN